MYSQSPRNKRCTVSGPVSGRRPSNISRAGSVVLVSPFATPCSHTNRDWNQASFLPPTSSAADASIQASGLRMSIAMSVLRALLIASTIAMYGSACGPVKSIMFRSVLGVMVGKFARPCASNAAIPSANSSREVHARRLTIAEGVSSGNLTDCEEGYQFRNNGKASA